MKVYFILILILLDVINANSSDNDTYGNTPNNFGVNVGLGTCIVNDRNYGLDACFHAGIDYTLDRNLSSLGLSYYKFNWNLETYTNNSYSVHSDIDMDVLSLLYRLPLGNLTVAIGPAIFYNEGISYFAPALDVGYLNNIGEKYGYEVSLSSFYVDKNKIFYFYLNGGLWIKI
jgi:hypothetical protein